MIGVVKLEKHFGGLTVLDGISFAVNPGERVALVGANGSGKTTLFKIISGQEEPDAGHVVLGPGAQIGYLGQEGQLTAGRTLYQEMMEVFRHVDVLESRMRELEEEMGRVEDDALAGVMEEYARVQTRFDHADPATLDARIHKVTGGLGFSADDLERDCDVFSGGWQMRGAMARLLLRAPDCLLLDEPTNHLDLEAMEWLEEYLMSYSGAVLMVSHDRVFLDKVSQRTLELRNGDLEEYAGNYSFYLDEAEKRYELRLQRYKNQQKKLEQERRFIERFRYKATLSTRVKSREKMLAKREMEDLPEARKKSVKMSFQEAESSGSQVLQVKGVHKSYGELNVLKDLSFRLQRGERLALVGANGSGKTTLLRILAGDETADVGRVKFDEFAERVYFAQHQAEALDPSRNVLDEVESVAPASVTQTEVRTLLGCFLFTGDDVFKPVKVLSGGEKSRVALTKCVLMASNVLLLDEPTNHLDIESREALQDALDLYEGTIIFVTHDRALMQHLSTKVLDLSAAEPSVFDGTFDEYRRHKQKELQREQSKSRAAEEDKPKKAEPARQTFQPKVDKAKRTPWKLEALEKKIFTLEEQLEELTEALADPALYSNLEEQTRVSERYEKTKKECEELTALWEEMA
jgi:ATP-binding cassette, subfamily F, member 3